MTSTMLQNSPTSFKDFSFDQVMEINPEEALNMTEEQLRQLVLRIQELRTNPAERRAARKETQHKVLGTTSSKRKLTTDDLL